MVGFGRAAIVAGALVVVVHSEDAFADERSDRAGQRQEEAQRAPHDWTLAAGIGLSNLVVVGGLGGATEPLIALMLERRLTKSLWLMGRASGSVGKSEQNVPTGAGGLDVVPVEARTVQGGGALGARWVFTPDRPLELSAFVTGGVSHARATQEATQPVEGVGLVSYESRSTSIQGQIGASVDRELTDGLGLRLSLVVAQGGWTTSQADLVADAGAQQLESEGLSAALTLSPTLEMRFSF